MIECLLGSVRVKVGNCANYLRTDLSLLFFGKLALRVHWYRWGRRCQRSKQIIQSIVVFVKVVACLLALETCGLCPVGVRSQESGLSALSSLPVRCLREVQRKPKLAVVNLQNKSKYSSILRDQSFFVLRIAKVMFSDLSLPGNHYCVLLSLPRKTVVHDVNCFLFYQKHLTLKLKPSITNVNCSFVSNNFYKRDTPVWCVRMWLALAHLMGVSVFLMLRLLYR
jgi:hypothetical protein